MKNLVIIVMFISITGCAFKSQIAGKYASNKNPVFFQFKNDSTFLNEYRSGHAVKYSTGRWNKVGSDSIVLNTEIKNVDIPLKLIDLNVVRSDSVNLTIDLKINNGLELANYYCYIYVNNKVFKIKRCDSLNSIKLTPHPDNIFFAFSKEPLIPHQNVFPLYTQKALVSNHSNNLKIEINFNDWFFYHNSFDNKLIKVKKGGIKIFNPDSKQWEYIPRVKSKTNIFTHFDG